MKQFCTDRRRWISIR